MLLSILVLFLIIDDWPISLHPCGLLAPRILQLVLITAEMDILILILILVVFLQV
jgi:hypothetical protein